MLKCTPCREAKRKVERILSEREKALTDCLSVNPLAVHGPRYAIDARKEGSNAQCRRRQPENNGTKRQQCPRH
jgi:hypothetical protein